METLSVKINDGEVMPGMYCFRLHNNKVEFVIIVQIIKVLQSAINTQNSERVQDLIVALVEPYDYERKKFERKFSAQPEELFLERRNIFQYLTKDLDNEFIEDVFLDQAPDRLDH